ncbi:HBL/NHE enterotoxin family protein [Aquimarina sp. RZ0]|uniref:HBL/NHE enterotoxin family protein n=1 Tax=Aquimarina sp. RZ0 TaxID=2607730 RepID=UPI0011F18149|nr:HBL/NHE enterotoxin family protein [Aquimarina sp. RZ0]KAA1244902.1 HBL/NHE enterotoxin family protein [Aquimarina sp. RZ0]
MNSLNNNIKTIEISQKDLTGNGLILQTYCNSVLQQPDIDFSSVPDLSDYQEQINESLEKAKKHANTYLNDINHKIINSLSDLNSYFTVYKIVPVTLPEGSSVDQWVSVLSVVKTISEKNLRDSELIVEALEELRDDLSSDSAAFASIAEQANDAIEGDTGELASIRNSLKEIDRDIKGQIAAVVLEGIGIIGGVFVIAIGSVSSFVTAGTSTPIVIAGVSMLLGGVVGLAVSAPTLINLYQEKTDLFQQSSKLRAEVNLLTGIDSAFDNLSNQAETAASATKGMVDSWRNLTNHLEDLIDDLTNGILSTDAVRTLFLNDANNEIIDLQNTINTIKQQMSGIITVALPKDETVLSYLKAV